MTTHAEATMQSKSYEPVPAADTVSGAVAVTGTDLASGGLEGGLEWDGLMLTDQEGAGAWVALGRFTGRAGARAGSFAVRMAGTSAADGSSLADVLIVAGTGTDALAGVTGDGTLVTGPGGSILTLVYDLG